MQIALKNMRNLFRKTSSRYKGLQKVGRIFKKSAMRLRTGHDGCVDDEPSVYCDRASTYSHDQVDRDAQEKREETAKADVDQARADCVDSNHVDPDARGSFVYIYNAYIALHRSFLSP